MKREMTSDEIDNFLYCARVGRLGVTLDEGPYVVPVGFVYSDGRIFFHSCSKGLKMDAIRKNPNVCFEVDEALSDISIYKSVMILGVVEIIDDRDKMMLFLQKLNEKYLTVYRNPLAFDGYLKFLGLNKEDEYNGVTICTIRPNKITSRVYVGPFPKKPLNSSEHH